MNTPMPHANVSAAPTSTQQQAQALYQQMEDCFEANSGGGSMPDVLRKLQTLALHLKWTASASAEKVASFICWAEILYSPRKHRQWNSDDQSGAEAVAHFMRCNLVSIRDILGRMEE